MQPRTGWKRTYIKLFVSGCLQGSIRYQLEADERGAWYDLILFSSICSVPGIISDNDGRPYPHSFIANRLNISEELLERTLEKCALEGRITDSKETGIHITNWAAYQSEYQRQKPYRDKKKQGEHRDSTVGYIKVGGEEFAVMQEQDGDKYYLNDKGEKVYVEFDDESGKYRLRN